MNLSSRSKVAWIAIITGVTVMGDAMLFIVLPLYWQDFGLTEIWQIGVLLSINRFIRLPLNPFVGYFYKHFQLRTGVFIALILAVITTLSYGIFEGFWMLVIMRALWGVAWSFIRLGGFLTVIDVTTDNNRGWHMGMYNGLWGLGGLTGMLAGGFLVDQTSILFVTVIFSFISLLAIPVAWFVVPPNKREKKDLSVHSSVPKTKWMTPFTVLVLATGITQGFIIMGLFNSTISPLLENVYQRPIQVGTIILGVATLAGTMQAIRWSWDPFIAPAIGKMIDQRTFIYPIILVPLIGGSILLSAMAYTSSIAMLILLIFLFQLLSTIFTTTTDTLAARAAVRTDRVKMMTAHTIVVDVGSALGPMVSFIILMYLPLSAVYIFASFLMITLAIFWIVFRRLELETTHAQSNIS
ncbi:MFS transporter [Oceanobacillus iheyensis]|uniref:MFS transporter n=1 Tax=Oceanobacillus iheyensis TaxID=182710 RepID=UPI003632E204